MGSGEDGSVLHGYRKGTNEWHALKFLSRSGNMGSEPVREWDILQQFQHPNIVRVLCCHPPYDARVGFVMCMPEADMSLLELQGRARCTAVGTPTRLCPGVVRHVRRQLLSTVEHVHAQW